MKVYQQPFDFLFENLILMVQSLGVVIDGGGRIM
jgi:hypothetical protein